MQIIIQNIANLFDYFLLAGRFTFRTTRFCDDLINKTQSIKLAFDTLSPFIPVIMSPMIRRLSNAVALPATYKLYK